MPRPRRRYTKTEKAQAVAQATLTSTEAASESMGIPRKTIAYWLDRPEFAELRQKTRDGVADEFWATIQVGVHRVAELLPKTDDLQKVATAVGILYDKHALLTGGSTSRSESRDITGTPSDADVYRWLRELDDLDRRPTDGAEGLAEPTAGERVQEVSE